MLVLLRHAGCILRTATRCAVMAAPYSGCVMAALLCEVSSLLSMLVLSAAAMFLTDYVMCVMYWQHLAKSSAL